MEVQESATAEAIPASRTRVLRVYEKHMPTASCHFDCFVA
jgi:hypothetical protein